MKIYSLASLLFVLLLIGSCKKEKTKDGPDKGPIDSTHIDTCIRLTGPSDFDTSPYQVLFAWTSCTSGTYKIHLLIDDEMVDSSIETTSTQYIHPYLEPGKSYLWFVTNGSHVSDTLQFETSYAPIIAGTYNVTAHYDTVYGGTLDYGQGPITIEDIGNRKIRFVDTSLVHTQFELYYNARIINGSDTFISYLKDHAGSYPDALNYYPSTGRIDMSVVAYRYPSGSNNDYLRWNGTKVK